MRFKCLLICLFFMTAPAYAATVTNIRAGESSDGVRVVVDMTGEAAYKVKKLANPPRLVIDLESSGMADFNPASVSQTRESIADVRFGRVDGGRLRIVVEFSRVYNVSRDFVLKPASGLPWRLVVDMTPEGTIAPPEPPPDPVAETAEDNADLETLITAYQNENAGGPPLKGIKPVIVIDPGHGGADPGAIGVTGLREKEVTLATSKELKRLLDATGKYTVYMTRSADKAVGLRERREMGQRLKADLFIALHADSNRNRQTKGLSIYTVSERASDKEALALAERENKADIIAGIDLSNEPPEVSGILIDLTRRETMNLSAIFAGLMVRQMSRSVTLLPNTHRFAGFAVLKAPDVPSVLLEMGYLSNRQEEALLSRPEYRAKLAKAAAAAVDKYFGM